MSIGPSANFEEEKVSKISRFSFTAKKIVANYFERPSHYLFYGLLSLGSLFLLAGRDPSYKYWILVCLVGGLNIATSSARHDDAEAKKPSQKRHEKRK